MQAFSRGYTNKYIRVWEVGLMFVSVSHDVLYISAVDAEAYSFILFFVGVRITFLEVTRRRFVFGFWVVLFLEKSFTHKRKRLVQMRCWQSVGVVSH